MAIVDLSLSISFCAPLLAVIERRELLTLFRLSRKTQSNKLYRRMHQSVDKPSFQVIFLPSA